eukprot:1080286-Lingulodinium_polyedra.AAC.1
MAAAPPAPHLHIALSTTRKKGAADCCSIRGRCSAGAEATRPKLLQESTRPLTCWIGPTHHRT